MKYQDRSAAQRKTRKKKIDIQHSDQNRILWRTNIQSPVIVKKHLYVVKQKSWIYGPTNGEQGDFCLTCTKHDEAIFSPKASSYLEYAGN